MKVIIVEDNPDHQIILKKNLKEHYKGIDVDTADGISKAIQLLGKTQYDTIVLDYRLKGESGIELVEWIHENGIETPVIMITAVEDVEVAVRAIKLGVYEYLNKNEESFGKLHLFVEKVIQEYKLKKKLEEAEFKYRTLVEGMNEAVFLLQKNGTILYISSSIERLLGYSEEENKDNFLSLLSEVDRRRFLSNHKKILSGKDIDPFILSFTRRDGKVIYIEINASIFAPDGKIIGVIGTIQDVTKHVLLEKEIESERKKVVDIFNSMVDWIYVIDGDYNIKFINEALAKQVKEPLRKKCYSLLYNRSKPCPFCKKDAIKKEYTVRWELRREDGRAFDIISSPLKNPDGTIYSMMILRDITRKKEAEEKYRHMSEETLKANQNLKETIDQLKQTQEQLIQSEKMAAIGHLVSGVAHELNNPLFSAMGYTELLSMDTEDGDENKEKLDNILGSIKRARSIVKDLLKFARRENIEKEIIDINDVVRQTLSLREFELRVNNISIECDLQKGTLPVFGNFVRLQQVLLNLFINAEHAIDEVKNDGLITVRTFLNKSRKLVVVEVSDNGREIPIEIMGQIFDPFFTTKEVGKGTGLGLSTSYGIIRDHEGEIIVRRGKNLKTFVISLPQADEKQDVPEQVSIDKGEIAAHGESILVVDDEPVIVNLLEAFFTRKGFSVITAESGNEALAKLKEKDVELIITDIKMPEMDGKRFYNEIRNNKPELLNKLLFITGDTLNSETRAFLKEFNGCYLRKPFSFDEITESINLIINKNSQRNLF